MIFSGLWRQPGCWRRRSLTPGSATEREDDAMTLDLWLAAVTAFALLLYLVAVLIRPERF